MVRLTAVRRMPPALLTAHLSRIEVAISTIASAGEWVLCERRDDHSIGDKHMRLPVANATRIVHGQIVMFRDYYDTQTVKNLGMG
jgi:limonene-1,2-epoxide hydrolase